MDKINLTAEPQIIKRDDAILLYIDKKGPFMKTAPPAWQEFWSIAGPAIERKEISSMMGLSLQQDMKDGVASGIYEAGVTLKSKPSKLPVGLKIRTLEGRKYARFVLTGSYSQLPRAYPAAAQALQKAHVKIDQDDYCIEVYLNSPQDTAEDKLQTEILFPIL